MGQNCIQYNSGDEQALYREHGERFLAHCNELLAQRGAALFAHLHAKVAEAVTQA